MANVLTLPIGVWSSAVCTSCGYTVTSAAVIPGRSTATTETVYGRVGGEEGAVVGRESHSARAQQGRAQPRRDPTPRAREEARTNERAAADDAHHRSTAGRRYGPRSGKVNAL